MSSHPIFLHKGSWREFKIAIALHLKGCAKHWDSHLSQKIFMILQREELRERYLSGFPPLLTSEKLDLALADIIDPMETLEELGGVVPHEKSGWRQAYMENYHPGRLTLNPDAYHHAYTESMGMGKDHVCKVLELGWANLQCGGSYCEGYRCPPREGEPYPGKHRLLDRPEHPTEPSWMHVGWAGLQDTYFLGGLPLIFWSRKRGDTMGMRVATEEFCQPSDPADYRTVHVANFQRGRVAGFQWRSSDQLEKYERMWYLPTEREYQCVPPEEIPPEEEVRIPRTFRSGSQPWIDKQAGVTHRCTDTYIHHIQRVEDIDVAYSLGELGHGGPTTAEEFLVEREGLHLKTLGGW